MSDHTAIKNSFALADQIAECLVARLRDAAELPDPDRWMTPEEAAAFVGFSEKALEHWRLIGGGPEFSRVSQRGVRYRRRDLIDWMLSKRPGAGE